MTKVAPPKYVVSETEIVPYDDFHIPARRKSRYIPSMIVDTFGRGVLICPRCSEKNPGLKHSEDLTCCECNLRMQLYGNGLHIWDARITAK